jgi:alanyl-tRNA synthetase
LPAAIPLGSSLKFAMMTSNQIRQSFLDFFKSKQHTIVPSSSLMPDSPNLLFTNAGMNQFVPIFLGQTKCPYTPGRAADTQKCIRAGGKHNDLDDVGLDTYHHTFFEMLGNWSFGDYFKAEAINWAWELVVEIWKFPPQRLYATVYNPDKSKNDPSDFDQEAWNFWAGKFRSVGLDPAVHIVNGNKKDNFWMMGDTGPCGPCSELHVDLTPEDRTIELEKRGATMVNKGDARCIEIWNLVFIQFNANPDGTFSSLPAKHVDTGMGFERATSIIQGTKNFSDFANAKISNYETDIFRPIFDAIEKQSGKKYGSTLPKSGSAGDTEQGKIDVAFRVIADHIRTLSFAIADGIQPGNNDRNYVLRRILRRAVRYGRTLGFHEPFFYKLVDVLAETMGDVFPEIRSRKQLVQDTIRVEEESFNKTLDKGIEIFKTRLEQMRQDREIGAKAGVPLMSIMPGRWAFELYDTYGFPLDLTQLMAREQHIDVAVNEFEKLMEEQRDRARAAQKKEVISMSQIETTTPTKFDGYENLETQTRVLEVVALKDKTAVVLDASVCYAEMGGQVGDTGELQFGRHRLRVANTQKSGNAFLHLVEGGEFPVAGDEVVLTVDKVRREAIQRHHTVTHLLHWALHEVASRDASQKGSSVGPDKLTFDFNSAPLTPRQLADIEKLVNERIVENAAVTWSEVPYGEVKNRRDVMQFFGDKYGDTVRVVQIGGRAKKLDGYSMELCGGTHTRATGEIGLFRIIGESAVAAGVRRIEALAGLEAFDAMKADRELIKSLAGKISSPIHEIEKKIETLLAQQRDMEKSLRAAAMKDAANRAKDLLRHARVVNATPLLVANVGEADGNTVQTIADALKTQFMGVIVLGGVSGENVTLVASVSPELQKNFQAGKIMERLAPMVGGKGGGRPDNARGGGKDVSKLDEALGKVKNILT